jgi:L-ribulose-5-phosphate 4-epimerase
MSEQIRELIALACRILGAEQQGDLVWGHVSARDPEGRGAWMKASSWGFDEVEAEHTVLVADTGEVLVGSGRRHAEYPIHTEIMAARPDVTSVVHTHAPHAIALATTGQPLRPVSHEGSLFTPPAVPRFEETADLILTRDLGRSVAATLDEHRALFLVNHGIVTVGKDVPTAVLHAILLERACRIQLLACGGGGATRWSHEAEALAKREHCYSDALLHQAWDHLVRRVSR